MAEPLFTGTQVIIYGGIAAVLIVIVMLFLKMSKKNNKTEPFVPVLFSETTTKALKNSLKLYGKKIKKGVLVIGFDVLAHIDRYYSTKGKMPIASFDPDDKDFKFVEDKDGNPENIEYDFTIFRLKNKSLPLRWLGLKKMYLIMRNKDDDDNQLIRFDNKTSRFFLPKGVEFDSYGNIWNESQVAKEYLNNISFLEMLQQTQTHLQNIPNRVVHLEVEQAKKERLYQTLAEIEKNKYDSMKKGEDTVIS